MAIQSHSWIQKNCLRAYPLVENSPRSSINTRWTLADDILVDCFIYVSKAQSGIMLSSVSFTSKIVSVTFADIATQETIGYASAIVGVDNPFTSVPILGTKDGCSGYCTFGKILDPDRREYLDSPGTHRFSPLDKLEEHCVMQCGDVPVKAISAFGSSSLYSGNVKVKGNDQIVLTAVDGTESDEPVTYVTISLANPELFLPICETRTETCGCAKMPVLTINGIPAPVTIVFDDGLFSAFQASTSEVRITAALPQSTTCVKTPVMPDKYGRLPTNFEKDCPPTTVYGFDAGPACVP
jgi:hypothetical protein